MGVLLESTIGQRLTLSGRVVVGRSHGARLRLTGDTVSSEHAVLWWDSGWFLRDLGSRNGTFVDGQRLDNGEQRQLGVNASLRFGTDSGTWVLDSATPPVAIARCEGSNKEAVAHRGLLCIPSPEDPEAMVFHEGSETWILESSNTREVVSDDQVVVVRGRAWRLMLPVVHRATQEIDADEVLLRDYVLCFSVSADEEFVALSLQRGGREITLKPRAHHYVLLTLTRQRCADTELAPAAQGWLYNEDVLRMLSLDSQHLNAHIYRARRQLSEAGISDAASIVERRATTGQLRLGTSRVVIRKL